MPLAELDWAPTLEAQQAEDALQTDVVSSMFWDLPAASLDGWRPFTATLPDRALWGPQVGHAHGIDFRKNLMFGILGPRGAAKTCSLSFILAKILRVNKPVWTNYPISFFVLQDGVNPHADLSQEFYRVGQCSWVNADNTLCYYESMPLNMEAFYSFERKLRHGAVGIDELQYFCEARTSGKYQNRILSYQIMQIRKTANTFGYTTQNPKWVDNRFGWSADFTISCTDLSKKSYDRRALGRELEEGEVSRWEYKDISGVVTGEPYDITQRIIGPYQFESKAVWNIYPTHFIIDVFEAMAGPDRDKKKRERKDTIVATIEDVANEFLNDQSSLLGGSRIPSSDFLATVNGRLPDPVGNAQIGRILASMGIKAKGQLEKRYYDFSAAVVGQREQEA
jgi:hypothetical protein